MAERGSKILHNLDRFIGIPILFILGLFVNKQKSLPNNIRRIAIIRTAAIGDTVLLSGIVQDLKFSLPNVNITFFVGASNCDITHAIPNVDKIIKLPIKNIFQSFQLLRKEDKYDIVIDTGQWPRLDALFSYFCQSSFRIGFQTVNQYKHFVFHKAIVHSNKCHEIENFRNLVRPFVKVKIDSQPILNVNSHSIVQNMVNTYPNFVVFHPWSGGMNGHIKEWGTNCWVELADKISKLGLQIFVTGAPKDVQNSELICNKCLPSINIKTLAGQLSLYETMELLMYAKVLISVNTGIMHIGSALNIPVIDLHGPTNSMRWGPLNKNSIAINSNGKGCGFINLGFEYKGNPTNCMEKISVEMVWESVIAVI